MEMQSMAASAKLSHGLIKMAAPLISPIKADRQNAPGRVRAFQVNVAGKGGSAFMCLARCPLQAV